MMKKMTKKEMLEQIKAQLTDAAQIEFIEHEIELLNRKNATRSNKPTATQIANEKTKVDILNFMDPICMYRISEIIEAVAPEMSNQKMSAVLKQMVDAQLLTKSYHKRQAFFSIYKEDQQ